MKNIFLSLVIIAVLVSCTKEKKGSMMVSGEIKGLKKGTLYLQKIKDTVLIAVDSINLDGVNTFSLSDELDSPEIYFLNLDNSTVRTIPFFGDMGLIEINTRLDKFVVGAEVKGQENQQLLEEYNNMISQYGNKNLDLIKAEFDAKKDNDSIKMDSVQQQLINLTKSKYRYTANFAISHGDREIAPYLALTQLYNANLVWLDSINSSLTKDVKSSKYGQQLDDFIAELKSKE